MTEKIIYSCACSTNLGILAQKVTSLLAEGSETEIVPLPDPFGDDTEFKMLAASAKLNIAIDGCHVGCAKKALKFRKIKHIAFCLTDYGCEKNKTPVDESIVNNLFKKIQNNIGEHCAKN